MVKPASGDSKSVGKPANGNSKPMGKAVNGKGRPMGKLPSGGAKRLIGAACAGLLAVAGYHVPRSLQPPESVETWLFFDGVCNLCDGFVNFVYQGDSANRVRFGALQKHKELLNKLGAGRYAEGGDQAMTTVVVIQGEEVYVRSSAALRVLAVMDQPWRSLAMFHLIPAALRDSAYSVIGRYRYAVFGEKAECMKPTGDFKRRFLDYDPREDEEALPFAAA